MSALATTTQALWDNTTVDDRRAAHALWDAACDTHNVEEGAAEGHRPYATTTLLALRHAPHGERMVVADAYAAALAASIAAGTL